MKDYGKYHYFIYVGNNPNYSFRNYVDPVTGQERGYVMGYDKHQQPILKEWFFNYSNKRQIRVSEDEVDKTGQKALDFLRSSPEFYGNPDGFYVEGKQALYMFREINEDKDAKDAVDTRAKVIEAQGKALKLKGNLLREVANVIGVFSDKESVLTHRVLDYSGNHPDKFMELVNDPTLNVRALVKRAINEGVFRVDGRVVKWETKTVGADEEDAVSALIKDENLLKAVKLNLEKFGSNK